jgi:hypothetical protein
LRIIISFTKNRPALKIAVPVVEEPGPAAFIVTRNQMAPPSIVL